MTQRRLDFGESPWVRIRDADPDARALHRRHYSCYKYRDGRDPAKFVGPGSYVALVTPEGDALFVWRKFIDDGDDGSGRPQTGVNCSIFRNESKRLSSSLILAAEPFALEKWPAETRWYTYVNAEKVRRKRDPGRCFRKAGWTEAGYTRKGLLILEKVRK